MSLVRHVISPTRRWSDKTHLLDTSMVRHIVLVRQLGVVTLVRLGENTLDLSLVQEANGEFLTNFDKLSFLLFEKESPTRL